MQKLILPLVISLSLSISMNAQATRSCLSLFQEVPEPVKTEIDKKFEALVYPDDDSTAKILADFEKQSDTESWIENELNFARFVRQATLRSSKDHPIDMYGEKNYKSFREADEYLKSIPRGSFQITNMVLRQTHHLASKGVASILKNEKLEEIIPDGFIPDKAGVFKKRNSIGRDPLFYPLTDKAVAALRANKWLGDMGDQHGFYELPLFSKPDQRRGFIVYSNPKNIRQNLDAFAKEMNEKMELAKKGQYDAAQLAAEVQLALVALHPFVDGNGRTSRLIMDRVLYELGLPPSLISDTSNDLYMTLEEWTSEIRKGLRTYIELQKQVRRGKAPQINREYDKAPNEARLGIGEVIDLRGLKLTFDKDGFLYDPKGIPHVFKNNSLYPIADSTYLLYVMSNKNQKFSVSSQDIFKSNYEFLQKTPEQRNSTVVLPYSTIKAANQLGKIYLYDWQRGLLKDLLTIEKSDALVFFGTLKDTFSSSDSPAMTIAEYEKIDHQLWTIKSHLDPRFTEEVALIEKAREVVFNSAKSLLDAKIKDLETKLGADLEAAKSQDVPYRIFNMIYQKSKLSKATYAQALRQTDDSKIYLLRSDSVFVEKIGFISQMGFKNLIKKIPLYKKLRLYLLTLNTEYFNAPEEKQSEIIKKWRELAEKIKNGDTMSFKLFNRLLMSRLPEKYKSQFTPENIETTFKNFAGVYSMFVNRILSSKYKDRGILDQYDRIFIDNYLQMIGSAAEKPGKSFSSNSALYASGYESTSIPYASSEYDSGVYLVEIDRKDVSWNEYSLFAGYEYEFVVKKRISRRQIKDKIRIDDYKKPWEVEKDKYDFLTGLLNPNGFGGSLKLKVLDSPATPATEPQPN